MIGKWIGDDCEITGRSLGTLKPLKIWDCSIEYSGIGIKAKCDWGREWESEFID